MKEAAARDEVIRQFLLGDLDEEARQRLEEAFIIEPETRDRVLMTENELIEEYLEDSLGAVERKKFLAYYLSAPQQRRKLKIAKSVREYVIAEAGARRLPVHVAPVPTSRLRTYLARLKPRHRLILIPLVAALTIAIIFGSIWLFQLQRLKSQLAREKGRRQAIERELVALNNRAGTGPEQAEQILALSLVPIAPRSAGPGAEITPTTKTSIVEFRLVLTEAHEYPGYRAVLKQVDKAGEFAIPNLHIENGPGNKAVRLRIPIKILTRGTYHVELSGVAVDGNLAEAMEYTFVVTG